MKTSSLQEEVLNTLRKSKGIAIFYLTNGFQIRGKIISFDNFVILVLVEDKLQMVYKHAISTVIPIARLSIKEKQEE